MVKLWQPCPGNHLNDDQYSIKRLSDGIQDFLGQFPDGQASPGSIANLEVYCSHWDDYPITYKGYAGKAGLLLKESPAYKYCPPKEASPMPNEGKTRWREEEMPSIADPNMLNRTWIIYDDAISSGKTLAYAIGKLYEKGVPLERMWVLTRMNNASEFADDFGLRLDRAEAFIRAFPLESVAILGRYIPAYAPKQ